MNNRTETIGIPRAIALSFLVAVAVYANSLTNGFAYDDVHIIEENERVHQLRDLSEIWLTPYWPMAGEVLGLYRPLTIFSYAVQWAVSDGAPWVFHLTNILLHGLVTVLVLLGLRKAFGTGAALAGTVIFAVHPVHTEAVANVVGQAEILAAAGVLAACLVYLYEDPERGLTRKRLGIILALYALAMLAKEGAVVLPGLLVLLDVARRRIELSREGVIRYVKRMTVPLAALTATLLAYLVLRMEVLGSIGGSDANPGLPFLRDDRRLLSAMRAWTEFVRLLFFPMDLSADYSPAVILPVESWTPMAILGAGLLGITIVLALAAARYPTAGAAAGWFFITILPVSNLLFPIGVLVAERTLYLPSVAVSILAAGVWAAAERSGALRARVIAATTCAVLTTVFAVRTVIRNPEWKDTEAVFAALYRDHPESYRAQLHAAVLAMGRGDEAASRDHWELAYRLWPQDPAFLIQYAYANLVWQQYDRTIELFEEAEAINPGYHGTKPYLGMAYIYAGRYEEALALTDRLFPKIGPHRLLFDIRGRAYAALGDHANAAASFRAATRQPGGDTWAMWTLLAQALAKTGETAEAEAALRTARSLAAGDSTSLQRIDAFLAGDVTLMTAVDSANVLQNAMGSLTVRE